MEPHLLREVERLALQVARDGALADPPVPAPVRIRPMLGFTRLTAKTRKVIRDELDRDEAFRARVAEAADEDEVGAAGWLWLHRPDGWEGEVAAAREREAPEVGPLPRKLAGAEAAAERQRAEVEDATNAWRRAEGRVAELEWRVRCGRRPTRSSGCAPRSSGWPRSGSGPCGT